MPFAGRAFCDYGQLQYVRYMLTMCLKMSTSKLGAAKFKAGRSILEPGIIGKHYS